MKCNQGLRSKVILKILKGDANAFSSIDKVAFFDAHVIVPLNSFCHLKNEKDIHILFLKADHFYLWVCLAWFVHCLIEKQWRNYQKKTLFKPKYKIIFLIIDQLRLSFNVTKTTILLSQIWNRPLNDYSPF